MLMMNESTNSIVGDIINPNLTNIASEPGENANKNKYEQKLIIVKKPVFLCF